MPIIKIIRGKKPLIPSSTYIAENATIVGEVILGENCSVWYNAVLRGDVNTIQLGNRVNIQDGAVVHCTFEKSVTILEDDVSIGHNAVIHGCKVQKGALIGMGAIVMDNVVVGEGSIVAAGAVVLANTIIPKKTIYAGVPAKKVKELSDEESIKIKIKETASNYIKYAEWADAGENVSR